MRPVRDRYEVVYGTRRLLSLRALGRTEALCTVEEMDRQGAMRLAFSENNERVNLSPVDEAVYFGQMLGVTDEQIFSAGHPRVSKGLPTHKNAQTKKLAQELGISVKRIEDRLPFRALPPDLARLVGEDGIPIKKAKALARLRLIGGKDEAQKEMSAWKLADIAL